MKPYLTLGEEIESVQRYLESELAENDGKLTREFFLDPEVDTDTVIPRNLVQVFVENALRNRITNGNSETNIHISINRSELGILVMVADSGLRSGTGSLSGTEQSEGLKILNSYLPVFNRQQKVSISYKILNLGHENGSPGSRVIITIKS
jgi:LytS/YehU family sensor histidine kinase